MHELRYQLILPVYFLFEHFDHIIFAFKHVCKIASQRCEAIVRLPLCFTLLYGHATFQAIVAARAVILLMLDDIHPVDSLPTVYAFHGYIWTNGFMLLNLALNAFRPTSFKSLTFDCVKETNCIVLSNLVIVQNNIAAHDMISAFELHLGQLLLYFLLDTDELRFQALHGTHSSFCVELL